MAPYRKEFGLLKDVGPCLAAEVNRIRSLQ